MIVPRSAATVALRWAAAGAVPVLLATAAGTAQAHGAPTDPVSRVAACGATGEQRDSAACKAAVAANGGAVFDAWDNVRLPNVQGQDRQVIPDGQLCSAGLSNYRGLDIVRPDWPVTELTSGGDFTLTYRSTVRHKGKFELYLTKEGHDPAEPLHWSDMERDPFAADTDPAFANGAYEVEATLPKGLTGRHILYTVWRTTDGAADTYYSCSDVILTRDTPAQSSRLDSLYGPSTADATDTPEGGAGGEESASPDEAVASAESGNSTQVIGGGLAALTMLALGTLATLRPPRRYRRHRRF
ncbi:lytic polysaccharide monooxygenase [Streptomyces sp. NPDC055078]